MLTCRRALCVCFADASPEARVAELVLAAAVGIFGAVLILDLSLNGNDAWGVPERTGPRRVPMATEIDHHHYCAPVDEDRFLRTLIESYTSLFYILSAAAVAAVALVTTNDDDDDDYRDDRDGRDGRDDDAPVPAHARAHTLASSTVAFPVALSVLLLARGVTAFLARSSARVDYDVASRASEWPPVILIVSAFASRLSFLRNGSGDHCGWQTLWFGAVALVAGAFVTVQLVGDLAGGVRVERWPSDFLGIGIPSVFTLIPLFILVGIVLECVGCVPKNLEPKVFTLFLAALFAACSFVARLLQPLELTETESCVGLSGLPAARRTRGYVDVFESASFFVLFVWLWSERRETVADGYRNV